jgi:predicted ATPase
MPGAIRAPTSRSVSTRCRPTGSRISSDGFWGTIPVSSPCGHPHRRTEGNPFFLEESVRTLIETRALAGERGAYRVAKPVEDVQIPATVQAVLAARIDRLPPDEKWLLQAAAVIGKDVPHRVLHAVVNRADEDLRREVAHLLAAEFLYETQLFPDLEYTFKHALSHDVAYEGLLQGQRRNLHAGVVAAFERLYPDRLGEQVERLAEHAVRGEVWPKALVYQRQAADQAIGRGAAREARAVLEHAISLIPHLPDDVSSRALAIDLRLEVQGPLYLLAEVERAHGYLTEARALAESLRDPAGSPRSCPTWRT